MLSAVARWRCGGRVSHEDCAWALLFSLPAGLGAVVVVVGGGSGSGSGSGSGGRGSLATVEGNPLQAIYKAIQSARLQANLVVLPPSEMSTYTLTINVEHTYSRKLRSNGFKLCFAKCINGRYSVVWDAVEYVVQILSDIDSSSIAHPQFLPSGKCHQLDRVVHPLRAQR